MSIFIKGKDCTDAVLDAVDSVEIAVLFEQYKDDTPKPNESASMLQQRNDSLLSAMLALHSNPKGGTQDFYY